MRRFCWCGAAAAAAVVGPTLLYVERHPNSTLARYALAVYRVSVEYNPLLMVSQKAAAQAAPLVQGLAEAVVPNVQATREAAHQAATVGESEEAGPACCPTHLSDVGDFLRAQADLLRLGEDGSCSEQHGKGCCCGHQAVKTGDGAEMIHRITPAMPEAGASEESEDSPQAMPLAEDHTTGQTKASGGKDGDSWWTEWFGILGHGKAKAPAAGQPLPGSVDTAQPGHPANCQENPAYPFDDPACPCTGSRPAHGKKPAAMPKEEGGAEEQGLMPPAKPSSMRKPFPPTAPEGSEESPAHPEVDTMEFRPSDAHPGEFDPHPM